MLTHKSIAGLLVAAVAAVVTLSSPAPAQQQPEARRGADRAARRHIERPQHHDSQSIAAHMRRLRMEYDRRVMRLEQMQALAEADRDRWLYDQAAALKKQARARYERAMAQLRERYGKAKFEHALSRRSHIASNDPDEKELSKQLAHWRLQRAQGKEMSEAQRRRLFNAWLDHQKKLREAKADKRRDRRAVRRDIPEHRRDHKRKAQDNDRRRRVRDHDRRQARDDRAQKRRERSERDSRRDRTERRKRDRDR